MRNPGTNKQCNSDKRRKAIRLAGFDYSDPNQVFFITLCTNYRQPTFQDAKLASRINESILHRAARHYCLIYAYCLMPDHLHLALSPVSSGRGVPQLLQEFKSYTTRISWQQGHKGPLWQQNYYDHIARREEDVLTICQYILCNPVRKGLVDDPADWPYAGMPNHFEG